MTGNRPVTVKVIADMIAKSISDSDFREKLLKKPDEVLNSEGFVADQNAVDLFKALANSNFDADLKKAEKQSSLDTSEASGNSGGGQSPQGNEN
jgi:hypothetical protein